jgi:alkanesulfonate monooxygenase SsuD/methylene tetrahydromethanopterin reductase-like flavin-dependent oxidoreductase (luciferase family)
MASVTDEVLLGRMQRAITDMTPIERRTSEALKFLAEVRAVGGELDNTAACRFLNSMLTREFEKALFDDALGESGNRATDDGHPTTVVGDPSEVAEAIVDFERIRDSLTALMFAVRERPMPHSLTSHTFG